MSELQELFGVQPQRPQLTAWDRLRRSCFYVGLASFSCLATQLARIMPPLLPVVGILMGAGTLGLLAWAWLTPGDQRLSITLAGLAKITGIALGLWDAVELLQLIGIKHWLAAGVILVIGLFVFMGEGHGRKN